MLRDEIAILYPNPDTTNLSVKIFVYYQSTTLKTPNPTHPMNPHNLYAATQV